MRNTVAFAIVLSILVTVSAQQAQTPASIPVVKTWQDLQAVPPIELGNGVIVRFRPRGGQDSAVECGFTLLPRGRFHSFK